MAAAGVAVLQETGGVGLLGEFLGSSERMLVEDTVVTAIYAIGQTITLTPAGHPVTFSWPAVAGATGAEVTRAGLRLGPLSSQKPIGALKAEASGNHYVVTTSGKRIYSLKLNDLAYIPGGDAEDVPLTSSTSIPGGFHLVVSLPDGKGGWQPPVHAVPPAPKAGMIPQTLTGASFDNRVLRLPDVVAAKIRLTLVEGDNPAEFEERSFSLGTVEGTETILPTDVQVVAPDGSTAWSLPSDLPPSAGVFDADLRVALEAAFTAAIEAGDPPEATFTITGSGTISLAVLATDGAVLRSSPGALRTILEGDPAPLALGAPLATETPGSATADLTVRYEGIRLLDTVTDAPPAAQGGLSGVVVTDQGSVREFPPEALTGRVISRIGLIGRAPVDCELEVQLVDATSGKAVGPPAVLSLVADTEIATRWAVLSGQSAIGLPTNLRVRATKGRFLWAGAPRPLVRVAIFDPEYQGREMTIRGTSLALAPTAEPETHLDATALPVAPFAGSGGTAASPPLLESDLFLTVDLADLVLRYPR